MDTPSEKDRLLDHNYDGIQEYDNPLPRWWIYIFWVTILFSLLYVLNLPGIGVGKGRIANYESDVAAARAKYGSHPTGESLPEATLIAWVRDPAKVAEGKAIFDANCMPCHRADGGGMIGPNLTDLYWIHGGKPIDLLKTVTEGVPQKGMPTWGQMMKPPQIAAVVAYVITLQGTNPRNPKPPQGIRADSVAAASAAGGPVSSRIP